MHKNVIVEEDSKLIAKGECIDWELLNNTTVLVTGSTGIIGSTLVKGLLMRNEQYNSNITVISLVRNIEKYNKIYCEYMNNPYIIPVMGDICDFKVDDFNIEYIIHAACETSSQKFVSNPVDTINTMVCGTNYIMQCAVKKHVRGVVFLSSMEVYGKPQENQIMRENEMGYLDPVSVRSSYSEGKRICETLCVSYATQFNLPVKMIRLAQTFGPGVNSDDMRVFAEFARSIIEHKDIRLLTRGETQRMYLYTADAATAVLCVLTRGANGEVYNAANEDTYCSVKEMAELVINELGNGNQKVIIDVNGSANRGFNPVQAVYLDTTKIKRLSWNCTTGLVDMYKRMIECM